MMSRSMRAGLLIALWGLTGCFDDPDSVCTEGAEGCPCLDLMCEAGLTCQSGKCVAGVATGTGTSGPPLTTGSGTTMPASTSMPPVTDDSTGVTETTPGTSSSGATTMPLTSGSSTGPQLCGNGARDDSEECDGTPGCTACELDSYDCNPINNVPCPMDFKCSVVEPDGMDITTRCLPFAEPPPGELYESNCFYDFGPHDEWCDVGLACALSSSTDACDVNCCVEFCDLTDPGFACGFVGDECVAFFTALAPAGLEFLGYCVRP